MVKTASSDLVVRVEWLGCFDLGNVANWSKRDLIHVFRPGREFQVKSADIFSFAAAVC